jgi:glycosyltransferase involved in cell wall biosynthesis
VTVSTNSRDLNLHLFEPGGEGGVFQHTVAIADILAEHGHNVVLHTACDAELRPLRASFCGCMSWHRSYANRRLRSVFILAHYFGVTIPHLRKVIKPGDYFHVEGRFKPGLLLVPYLLARLRGCRVVSSPHNLFERNGSLLGRISLRAELALTHSVLVFSRCDQEKAHRLGVDAIYSPLVMHMCPTTQQQIEHWRSVWGASDQTRIILFAGQLRPDKRLDLLIHAMVNLSSTRWRLAIVGEDKGSASEMHALASRLGVDASWNVAYADASDFAAAIMAADVIACPYDHAGQSAILALARQAGVPSVARDVGGLSELATVTVPSTSPNEIADACILAAESSGTGKQSMSSVALMAHLKAYSVI